MKKLILQIITIGSVGVLASACAPIGKEAASKLASETTASVACKSADSYFFNYLNSIALKGESFPAPEVVEASLREKLESDFEMGRVKVADKAKLEDFIQHYMAMYKLTSQELPEKLELKDPQEIFAALSGLELGDRTTEAKRELQDKWEAIRKPLVLAAADLEGGCEEPPPEPDAEFVEPLKTPLIEALQKNYPPAVFGGMKAVAVSYQSCDVLNLKPMDEDSPSVKGVEVYGRHSNGSGNLRRIASLSDVQRTHYYIRDQYQPSTSCFNVREKPLIYDYGGKPYASSSMSSSLDMFKNAGSGAPGLGIDCSGYVFTAHATAGLKWRRDQPLKASQVSGINSRMMMNPQDNGLTCMAKITNADIKPGDVLASSGHVVLIDAVGSDPFGVGHITKESDCKTSKISASRFNFVISQSSPSKGAIGINRMQASEYFPTSSSMYEALKVYAVSACLKRFGKTKTPSSSKASITRHKGTSECKTAPVNMNKQECLASCRI